MSLEQVTQWRVSEIPRRIKSQLKHRQQMQRIGVIRISHEIIKHQPEIVGQALAQIQVIRAESGENNSIQITASSNHFKILSKTRQEEPPIYDVIVKKGTFSEFRPR